MIPDIRNTDRHIGGTLLQYGSVVAGHESFAIAARQLNVSQSEVSGQVRDLEKKLS